MRGYGHVQCLSPDAYVYFYQRSAFIMKWTYAIKQKTTAALVLTLVLAVIFGKNLLHRDNVSELGESFSSVYKDRLMVEAYIFELSEHLHQKKAIADACDRGADPGALKNQMDAHNTMITELIADYEQTKLTEQERVAFTRFRQSVGEISAAEAQCLATPEGVEGMSTALDVHFHDAFGHLARLSDIQVAEAKFLNDYSQKIVAESSLLSHFEMAMLIVVGVLIHALLFASQSLKPKVVQRHPGLN